MVTDLGKVFSMEEIQIDYLLQRSLLVHQLIDRADPQPHH